jgi:hypothetical protein
MNINDAVCVILPKALDPDVIMVFLKIIVKEGVICAMALFDFTLSCLVASIIHVEAAIECECV